MQPWSRPLRSASLVAKAIEINPGYAFAHYVKGIVLFLTMATACTQGKRTKHGKPLGVVSDDQPDAREDRPGALGWRRGS